MQWGASGIRHAGTLTAPAFDDGQIWRRQVRYGCTKSDTPYHGILSPMSFFGSVTLRIRLTRSFDQRSNTYLGYAMKVSGRVGSEAENFASVSGKSRTRNTTSGSATQYPVDALPVADPRLESVEYHKISKLKVGLPAAEDKALPPRGEVFPRRLRSTASAVIGDLPPEPSRGSAGAASGDAECRSR
jgi:hypothetical protein